MPGEPRRILVVEDEAVSALALQYAVERAGHRVVAVVDRGEAALDVAAAEAPDLALMDVRLKGEMNGLEAARLLQERHAIPSIFLTAYGLDEFQRLDHDGAPEPLVVLMKPVLDDRLQEALEQVLPAGP